MTTITTTEDLKTTVTEETTTSTKVPQTTATSTEKPTTTMTTTSRTTTTISTTTITTSTKTTTVVTPTPPTTDPMTTKTSSTTTLFPNCPFRLHSRVQVEQTRCPFSLSFVLISFIYFIVKNPKISKVCLLPGILLPSCLHFKHRGSSKTPGKSFCWLDICSLSLSLFWCTLSNNEI